jgi:2-polyprenyl-3-methyl-5-hydroxy-6-metoxy-1,4-benzoquinol methylase
MPKMTEDYAREYLKYVGAAGKNYKYEMVPCEICGSTEFTVIREVVGFSQGNYGKLPVQGCNRCGYLMQNPRFDRTYYQDFYRHYYRLITNASSEPSKEFIDDQIVRGRSLFEFLKTHLPVKGAMLDVGCSSGAFLIPYKEIGWEVYGTDPDQGYVKYGRDVLGLPIEIMDAEDMKLDDGKYDLIIIMGSLEHVYDPNVILQNCRRASKDGALLVLEGRFAPLGLSKNYFNHNHHRYLRKNSIELTMIKHGWRPFIITEEMICSEARIGNGYCVGRAVKPPSHEELIRIIEGGKRVDPQDILRELDLCDQRAAAL